MSNDVSQDFRSILDSAKLVVKNELDLTEQAMLDVAKAAPTGISERLEHLMQRKGKRIRSTLLSLVASSGKTRDTARIAQACAGIELLHLASLVHDDIIDSTEMRRGVKTAHKEWGSQVAVLIGDYLLSQAMRSVMNDPSSDTPRILSDAADALIIGEIQELDNCGDFELSYDTYMQIIKGKTAALSDAAARLGALLAGFDKDQIEKCGKMGADFGIAFQIIDDLLDYGYGAKDLDKAKFTDIANGLMTLPMIFYFEKCSETEKNEMKNMIARASEVGIAEKIHGLLNDSGAFERTKKTAVNFLDSAVDTAESLPDPTISEHLAAMFAAMAGRHY